MTRKLSIDPGYVDTGLSVWDGGKPTYCRVVTAEGAEWQDRIRHIVYLLDNFELELGPFVEIALEIPGPKAPAERAASMYKLWSAVGAIAGWAYGKIGTQNVTSVYTGSNPKEHSYLVAKKFGFTKPGNITKKDTHIHDAIYVGYLMGWDRG